MIKQNYKHEHMFGICFVWVYIIKGKVIPLVKSASIGRLCKRTNVRLWEKFSRLPKVVFCKGKQNGLFRVLLLYKFLRQYAVLSLSLSERLEMTDQHFKQASQRSKNGFGDRSILWCKFLGTTLLQLHIRISNPCEVETLLSVF